jgi:uncharacterized membrane protein
MESNQLTETIGQQDWLEPAAETLQQGVAQVFRSAGDAGGQIEDFLHGKWLGHPLHPVLTDVPLGAWTVSTVLDVVEETTGREDLAAGADAAIAIGLVGAIGSAVTGLTDWHRTEGKAQRVGLVHGVLNLSATALFTASWILRKQNSRAAARRLGWLGYAIVSASAYLGGELVYDQKVGVKP